MTQHDQTAIRVARKYGAPYNRGKGPDIETARIAIEVETAFTVSDGFRQLSGRRKPVYIAGADQHATSLALSKTRGTDVGVMDPRGTILKRSSRTY